MTKYNDEEIAKYAKTFNQLCEKNKITSFWWDTNLLIKRDKLLNLVYKEKNKMEEERRLFYVALTRSKNYVFLFVDKNNPSIFIKEILKESKNNIEVLDL